MRFQCNLLGWAVVFGVVSAVGEAVDRLDASPAESACTPDARPPAAIFYVSPNGNDGWSGRFANPQQNDGPFATVGMAREAVRAHLKAQNKPRPVRVVLRAGTYYLNQPLQFGTEDSGTEGAPVVYAAAPGEEVVISGGRRLEGGQWVEVNGQKAWVVDLPEVKEGQWNFRQLFVNGERRPRTRLPREGFYHIEAVPDRDPNQGGDDIDGDRRFVYAGTDLQPWHNLQDVEVVAVATCVASRMLIQEIDVEQRLVTFDRTSRGPLMYGGNPVYWVENMFEAMDTPGQWYLDRPLGRLYYLPKPGEDMQKAEVIAPRLPQLVRVEGTKDAPVKHLRFEGITFAHTEWLEPPDWPKEGRYTGAWYDIPGAIRLTNAIECAVTRCVIEHGVAYGVEVREGCRDVEISRNRMSDLGAGGVKLWFNSARTTVADNEIGHTGMIFLTSYGICVGDSPGNQIIYNHIYARHYTGILLGWAMQFEESNAYGNIVEHNHIHDIGLGVMSDMGGIYTEGICAGTRIRYNVVHDIRTRLGDNNGIYHDSGADILVEKNLVYRCTPLHIHYTRNIMLENNIFALGEWAQVTRAGVFDRPLLEYTFRRNIIYFHQGRVVGSWNPDNRNCAYDCNLYWNVSGKPLLFGDNGWAEWQAAGYDKNSIIADPLFVDAEHGDFRLKPGSPAEKTSFEPWALSDVGPRPSSGATAVGKKHRADWLQQAGWGVFTHYLGDAGTSSREWNLAVDSFDVAGLAAQLSEIGVKYYFITLGQNSGHYCSPNATYDSYVGNTPSKCSRRDLVVDLYTALEPLGIKLLVYLPSGAPDQDPVAMERLQWRRGPHRNAEFQVKWEAVIREWSRRWGKHVAGWWFDGCYWPDEMYRFPDPPNFATFAAAARAGNPDAIVAFNNDGGVIQLSEDEDYTAGETTKPGERQCRGRWVDGAQWHILSYLGPYWAASPPRFDDRQVLEWTRKLTASGGAVTWDVPIQPDGHIPNEFMKQLKALSDGLR